MFWALLGALGWVVALTAMALFYAHFEPYLILVTPVLIIGIPAWAIWKALR